MVLFPSKYSLTTSLNWEEIFFELFMVLMKDIARCIGFPSKIASLSTLFLFINPFQTPISLETSSTSKPFSLSDKTLCMSF